MSSPWIRRVYKDHHKYVSIFGKNGNCKVDVFSTLRGFAMYSPSFYYYILFLYNTHPHCIQFSRSRKPSVFSLTPYFMPTERRIMKKKSVLKKKNVCSDPIMFPPRSRFGLRAAYFRPPGIGSHPGYDGPLHPSIAQGRQIYFGSGL